MKTSCSLLIRTHIAGSVLLCYLSPDAFSKNPADLCLEVTGGFPRLTINCAPGSLCQIRYVNESQTGLYVTGQVTISNSFVNWGANGYRLPTVAEWERAARGGAAGMGFPWSDTNVISHTRANYSAGNYDSYDQSPTLG